MASPEMENPTIVLVKGAWQSHSIFEPLQSALEAKSWPSLSKSPPSTTEENGLNVDLAADVTFLREQVLLPLIEDGKDIVVIMHSYGGVYGAGAVQGLSAQERREAGKPSGVLGLIFVSAACVPVGVTLFETMGIGDDLLPWVQFHKETGKVTVPEPIPLMFNQLPTAEAEKWAATLHPQAIKPMQSSRAAYAAFSDPVYAGRCAYLLCEDDHTVPLHGQKKYMELAGITLSATLPTSHLPWLDMPEKTADTLIELVEKFKK